MGAIRDSLEVSLSAAIELDTLDADEHAAVIAGARATADLIDADEPKASLLTAYLNYCKALGIVPTAAQTQQPVIGAGKIASMRAGSRARLRAV